MVHGIDRIDIDAECPIELRIILTGLFENRHTLGDTNLRARRKEVQICQSTMSEVVALILVPVSANWTIPFVVPIRIFEWKIFCWTCVVIFFHRVNVVIVEVFRMRAEHCRVFKSDEWPFILWVGIAWVEVDFRCERQWLSTELDTFLYICHVSDVRIHVRRNIPGCWIPICLFLVRSDPKLICILDETFWVVSWIC